MNEKCEWTHARLSAAQDGALPGPEQARVDEHLVACDGCRAVMEEIRHADDLLGPRGPFPEPPLATDDLLGRLHLHLERERQASSVPWWRGLLGRGLMFAVAGGLAAVLIALRPMSEDPPPRLPQIAVVPAVTSSPAPIVPPALASPAAVASPAATPPPAVEVSVASSRIPSRIHQEMKQIQQEMEGIDRRFVEFQQEARRLAGEQDRQFADRRLPEWK